MFSIHKPSKMVVISGKASCYCSRETQEGQSEGWNTAWFGRKEAWIEYRVSERLETTMFFCEVCKLTRWVTTLLATSLEIPCQFGDMSISLTSKSDPTDLCGMVMPQDQKICRIYIPSNLHCLYLSLYHLVFGPVNTKTSHLNNRYGNLAMDNAFLVNFGAWSFGVHCSTDMLLVRNCEVANLMVNSPFLNVPHFFEFLTLITITTMVVSKFFGETPEEAKGNQPIYACSERRLQWRVVSYLEPCLVTNFWMVLLCAPTFHYDIDGLNGIMMHNKWHSHVTHLCNLCNICSCNYVYITCTCVNDCASYFDFGQPSHKAWTTESLRLETCHLAQRLRLESTIKRVKMLFMLSGMKCTTCSSNYF